MRPLFKTTFDIFYIVTVCTMAVMMIRRSRDNQQYRLFGIMSIILSIGDAFLLLPYDYGMYTGTLSSLSSVIHYGKYVSALAMTIFYAFLYHVGVIRYHAREVPSIIIVYLLAVIHVIFCRLSFNHQTEGGVSLSWTAIRSIPFLLLVLFDFFFFLRHTSKSDHFRLMPLAIVIGFLCYIPVFILSSEYPALSFLMIPEALTHIWMVIIASLSKGRETA